MVVLLLFRLFFYTIPNRKQHAAVDASPAPEAAPAASDVGSDDNGALAAAITAAVAAYLDAEAAEQGSTARPHSVLSISAARDRVLCRMCGTDAEQDRSERFIHQRIYGDGRSERYIKNIYSVKGRD